MKYSFMSFSCPELNLDDMLNTAKEYGYAGIEPRIESGHAHGIEVDSTAEFRKEALKKAKESGIEICCIATSRVYSDPTTNKKHTDETLKCIDLAADVGASRIRVFGGTLPESITREAAFDLVSKSFLAVAEHAESRGVYVCMETHDSWCDPKHVVEIMKRVNKPFIAVNWDIMHPIRQGNATMDSAFEDLKPWIKHIHFHDGGKDFENFELKPVGKGDIDHKRAVELLMGIKYDGFLSGEWIGWEPWKVHLPREIAAMKSYEK